MNTTSDAYRDLEDYLLDDLGDPGVDEAEELRDDDHANRLLRALRRARDRKANVVEVAEAETTRILDWMDDRVATIDADIGRIEGQLQRYHEAVLTQDARRKTIKLSNGTLKSTAQAPEWTYPDEAAFLAWARENAPELVRPPVPGSETIDKNAVKQTLVIRDEKSNPVKFGVHPTTHKVPPGLAVDADRPRKYEAKTDLDPQQ